MPVAVQTPYNEYTGNGVTTTFAYQFKVLQAQDLTVTVDGVEVLPANYTLTGLGADVGGTVIFDTAPANLSAILFVSDVVLERSTDYQPNGDLPSGTLDADFDRIWLALTGQSQSIRSAIRVPAPETVPALPKASARAGLFLAFDPSGNPIVSSGTGADSGLRQDLAATALAPGGAGLIGYLLNAPGAVGQTLSAWLDERIGVSSFGAVGDGVADDSAAIQKALDALAARGSGSLYLPGGRTYKAVGLHWSGTTDSRLCMFGDGPSTRLMLANTTGDLFTGDGGSIDISDMEVGHPVHDASVSGYVFKFTNTFPNVRRVDIYNGYNGIYFGTGCDQGGAVDILARGLKNDLFFVDVSAALPPAQQHGNMVFERIRSQAYNTNTGAAFRLTSGDGIFLTHVQAHGYQNGVIGVPSASRSYLANLFFDQVIIDGAGGPAIAGPGAYFDGAANPLLRVYWSNSWIGSIAGGRGLHAKNTKTISWNSGTIIDNAHEGVVFDAGCEECSFMDSVVTGNGMATPNTYPGILVFGADAVRIGGNRSGATHNGTDASTKLNTQNYGIQVANASTINYAVYDNDLRGNLSGTFQDGGGGGGRKVVRDN